MEKPIGNLTQSQLEKLATMGILAAEFGHLIPTLAQGLLGSIELIESYYNRGDEELLRKGLQHGKTTSMILGKISGALDNMLRFDSTFGETDVNKEIMEVIVYITPWFSYDGVEISVSLGDNLPLADIIPGAYQLCLLNTMINSKKAGSSKHICVSTEYDKGYVVTTTDDEGRGIEPEYLERITDPFFTIKTGGAGIGLASTKRIMDLVGGELIIESELGKGTKVTTRIPEYKPQTQDL